MFRRTTGFALVALALAQAGCHTRCDRRPGLFTSHTRGDVPARPVGANGVSCFDAAGRPMPCPPDTGAPVVPGGSIPIGVPSVAPGANELHMPAPTDLIRPPAVPLPAPPGSSDAGLPFPNLPGTPVKQK